MKLFWPRAMQRMGYRVTRQVPVAIDFEGLSFDCAFRIDILVEDSLIVEVKSVEQLGKIHAKQLLTYLRLTKQPAGLLLNFSAPLMRDGIRRLVNGHQPGK